MLNIIRKILQQYIDEIDSGNSNISEKEAMKLIDIFKEINKKELSALEACDYIGVSKSTFYNYIDKGKIPKGEKKAGKGVVWYKSDLNKFLEQEAQ